MAKNKAQSPSDDLPPFLEEAGAEEEPIPAPAIQEKVGKTDDCFVVLAVAAALGNGTREAGTLLAIADRKDGWIDEASIKPAEGIEAMEIANALMNPKLLRLEG